MYYYAYIDYNGIAIGTYGFPSVIDLPNYIYIGQTDDRSLVGKRWNASRQTFEEVGHKYGTSTTGNDTKPSVGDYLIPWFFYTKQGYDFNF